MLEMRIAKLKDQVANARIIDESKLQTDAIQIMSKVRLRNVKTQQEMNYVIVAESEANLREGKVSIKTPIAKALLGRKVGDIVEVKVPAGILSLEILNISI
jgi:transcription elongation factor GreA